MELNERLEFFSNLINCCHNLYIWEYDNVFNLESCNCKDNDKDRVNTIFLMSSKLEKFDEYFINNNKPVIFTNVFDMMWSIVPLWTNSKLNKLYVLGPFFIGDVPINNIEKILIENNIPPKERKDLIDFLYCLPIISMSRVAEYTSMFYYAITNEKINLSELIYHSANNKKEKLNIMTDQDKHGTYEAEQEMLRLVSLGDFDNLKKHMEKLSVTGKIGKLSNGDPLRQVKNEIIVLITLLSRAAIKGGLPIETSLSLSDYYFQAVEAATSITDLTGESLPMVQDYTNRVRQIRMANHSKAIRDCFSYIELHMEEEISLSTLADLTGYTEHYLSKKFKKEVGMPPSEYLLSERLKRAAFLLSSSKEDMQTISTRLQFCSQSHFSDSFKKQYNCTPSAYREKVNG